MSRALSGDPRGPALSLDRGPGRLLRGAVAGTVCVALSLAWHSAAGGAVPGAGALLLVTCLAAGVCVWWADRRRGAGALALLTVGLQAGVHVLLQLVTGHGAPAGPAMTLAHLAAAVGVGWFLAWGESALWELCGALTRPWVPGLPPTAAPASAVAAPESSEIPRCGTVLARAVCRRGPPATAPA